jgi:eukaryotic-like serine/threonine-protein kinase
MNFNLAPYTAALFVTNDMKDRAKATQASLYAGLLGKSPVAGLLLGMAAREGGPGVETKPKPGPSGTVPDAPVNVQVPKVKGDLKRAEEAIESRGLVASRSSVVSSKPIRDVIDSAPEAGEIVPIGSTVTIFLSAGLPLPDVVGEKLEDATTILEAVGFREVVESPRSKEEEQERVESQDPPAGGLHDAATRVTLHIVSRKDKPGSEEPEDD